MKPDTPTSDLSDEGIDDTLVSVGHDQGRRRLSVELTAMTALLPGGGEASRLWRVRCGT